MIYVVCAVFTSSFGGGGFSFLHKRDTRYKNTLVRLELIIMPVRALSCLASAPYTEHANGYFMFV